MYSFRHPARKRVSFEFTEPSLTNQSEKDSCDVNRIVNRHFNAGMNPFLTDPSSLCFGDASAVPDYLDAMNLIADVNETFEALPVTTRDFFRNDPKVFLEFTSNPQNIDTMRDLGLVSKREGGAGAHAAGATTSVDSEKNFSPPSAETSPPAMPAEPR